MLDPVKHRVIRNQNDEEHNSPFFGMTLKCSRGHNNVFTPR